MEFWWGGVGGKRYLNTGTDVKRSNPAHLCQLLNPKVDRVLCLLQMLRRLADLDL